jgi:hypothetical protein
METNLFGVAMRIWPVVLVLKVLLAAPAHGQQALPPPLEWQRAFGGADSDTLFAVEQLTDGGFILGGQSYSPTSGNKTAQSFGFIDYWIVRLDAQGNQQRDRCFGRTSADHLTSLQQATDGGYIIGGGSWSTNSGNKRTGHFGALGADDFWVICLDPAGIMEWEQNIGGLNDDFPSAVAVTSDGGAIIGGRSFCGISGTKTSTNYGACDFWAIRLDADGNKLWEAAYGGSRTDGIESLQQTRDGGFILGGWSYSPVSGNKTEPPLGFFDDYWILKLGPEQPQLRLFDPAIVVGGLRLSLSGIKNLSYCIEWSGNLTNWTSLQTNRMSNSVLEILDSSVTNSFQRFYRARQLQ